MNYMGKDRLWSFAIVTSWMAKLLNSSQVMYYANLRHFLRVKDNDRHNNSSDSDNRGLFIILCCLNVVVVKFN